MQPYVLTVAADASQSFQATGNFIYYLSGPDKITLNFETVEMPSGSRGRTYEIPIKPGDRFRAPPGQRFTQIRVTNNTSELQTRIEILAGEGEYIPGPEPISLQAPNRLHFSNVISNASGGRTNKGAIFANHIDSPSVAYVSKIWVQTWNATNNSDATDQVQITAGENATTPGSSTDTLLAEVGQALTLTGSKWRAEPLDLRFRTFPDPDKSQVFLFNAIMTATGIAPGQRSLWVQGQHYVNEHQSPNAFEPSSGPVIVPPGHTITVRSQGGVGFERWQLGVGFEWYELPIGA